MAETQFEKLSGKRPCFRFFITATPVPALLALAEEDEVDDIEFWKTTPCDDYVGVEDMVRTLYTVLVVIMSP